MREHQPAADAVPPIEPVWFPGGCNQRENVDTREPLRALANRFYKMGDLALAAELLMRADEIG